MTDKLFPDSFADLADLATEWSLGSEEERFRKRVSTDFDTLEAFTQRVAPHMEAVIDYLNSLNTNDPERLTPPDRRLFDFATTYMEASIPVDLDWGRNDIVDAFPPDRFEFLGPSKKATRF